MLHTLELRREDSSLTEEGGDPVGDGEGAADSDDIQLVSCQQFSPSSL